jgi:Na+/H+-dicarboxylate symporter
MLFFPAELILRVISFISLPLVVSSIASSLGALDYATSSKVMARTVLFFVLTGLVAVGEAVALSYAIRPGKYAPQEEANNTAAMETADGAEFAMDFFR